MFFLSGPGLRCESPSCMVDLMIMMTMMMMMMVEMMVIVMIMVTK